MSDNAGNKLATLILKKEWDLEMSLKSNKPHDLKFQKVQSLVSTYSQAIEYYQSIDNDLYTDLNLRMQNLLTKQETLEILDHEAEIQKASSHPKRWIQRDDIPKPSQSKLISPDKANYKIEENRNSASPDTTDSSIIFEHLNEGSSGNSNGDDDKDFGRSTFWVKDLNTLEDKKDKIKISSKCIAQFEVVEHSNEFVYHKNDSRNRHGVSFKVWRNKNDGALLRPKVIKGLSDKRKIHSELLNENNDDIESKPRIFASKRVIEEYGDDEKEGATMRAVEKDMYQQEAALKIRLLKRESHLAQKRKVNMSQSNSESMSGSSSN